ncbi:hypothetical protein BDR05DRAFT_1038691 [Suillus weaverae]|nr:hypothetical protein BDR05DRAFT_1038691 [Suillus weaverae]
MRKGLARILLFEQQSKNIVLGSFGAGVFRNHVEVVLPRLWGELLIGDADLIKWCSGIVRWRGDLHASQHSRICSIKHLSNGG